MRNASIVALITINLLASCAPLWKSSLGIPKVRPLAAAELGCPVEQLDARPIDAQDGQSPITVKGCGKDATYIFAMGIGYVLSSVRNGSDVAMRKPSIQ